MKEIRFRAYSASNPDIDYVWEYGRLRGCQINEPILIIGETIEESEIILRYVKEKISKLGIKIENNRIGSFSINVDEEAAHMIFFKWGRNEKDYR